MGSILPGLLVLAYILTTLPAAADDSFEKRLERAWRTLRAGDAAAAAPDLVAAAKEEPHTPAILLAAAEALARSGKHAEAVVWLERAAALGGVGDLQRIEDAFSGGLEVAGVRPALATLRANASPVSRGTVAFTLAEKDLIPESVAYDARDRVYYVGSLHKRKIVRFGPDGIARDFVPQAADGLWTVIGMKIEPKKRELWANACNSVDASPPMVPEDAATLGRAGVFRFDLDSGRLVRKHLAGSRTSPVCFNDLVITNDGTAWISAGPDGIYRLRADAESPERFIEYPGFVNGIAASDDGKLVFLADNLRGVRILEPATRVIRTLALPDNVTLAGIDGLYVRGRTLVAVQNGLGKAPERVIQAELDSTLSSVTCLVVLDRDRPEFDIPTTGVLVGDDLYYVASSQLRRFDKTGLWPLDRLIQSTIIRTRLAGNGCAL